MIDAVTLPCFAGDLEQAIEAGATRLLVDLARTDSVGTGALNALLHARGQLLERGGKIVLVVPPELRRLCEILALDRRFLLADDRLQAAQLLGLLARREAHDDFRSLGAQAA